MKIERLGLRALNDYTRRSQLTYLALRYAMEASAGRKDRWAVDIAPAIIAREASAGYHIESYFKEFRDGRFVFRKIGSPGPNEALAEAALLEACSKAGGPFSVRPDVFSYRLSKTSAKDGSYQAYFEHFKRRQRAIGRCCRKNKDDVVLYADIKNFYPSLSRTRVKNLWKAACAESKLEDKWLNLGTALIERQKIASKGLLVGPMFSHLLADLALRDFDVGMRKRFRGKYFRYVDDIAVILPASRIASAKKRMHSMIKPMGLSLSPDKFSDMPASEWASKAPWQGKPSEIEERDKKWVALIDRVKCYLIKRPDRFEILNRELSDAGLRIPLPRYRSNTQDADYQKRLKKRMESRWFRKHIYGLTVKKIVRQAKRASLNYIDELNAHWANYETVTNKMERKWHATKIKGILGRLTMLAPYDDTPRIIKLLHGRAEFSTSRAIFIAIHSDDVSDLTSFGGNVCAAAGQILATTAKVYECCRDRWRAPARQGYAMLCLMGVNIKTTLPAHVRSFFDVRFVLGDYKSDAWRKMDAAFPREAMAISKGVNLEKNRILIHSPLNPDDEWVLLADELNKPVFS